MSVFSDSRVIKALEDFIPVAQNTVFFLSPQKDAQFSKFYRGLFQQAHGLNSPDDKTMQGLYTFGADGLLYSALNVNDPDEVLTMLKTALKRFQANPPQQLSLTSRTPQIQPKPPAGTLIVRSYSRIVPLPGGANRLNASVGRDFLWIRADEVTSLVQGQFPSSLTRRLTRFHLWDNVRGEPDAWEDENVKVADFKAEVSESGGLTTVHISGPFRLEAPAGRRGSGERALPPSGFTGNLEGFIDYNKNRRQVMSLRWLADGQAWGESTFTQWAPPGRFPLKIVFVQADDEVARQLAPQGVSWGDSVDDYLR